MPRKAPEATTQTISAVCERVQHGHHDQDRHDRGQRSGEPANIAVATADPRRNEDGENREQQPPARERIPELVDAQVQHERRVGQQREEAEVVEDRGQSAAACRAMPQRAQRLCDRKALALRRRRCALQEHEDRDEPDAHQHGDAEERAAPADAAELPAEQRAERDAETERRLVEHDRAGHAAAGRADDHRQRRGDEERVPEPPAGAQSDDRSDAVRAPAAALKAMISTRPASSVRLAPMRLATTLETSIEMPVNGEVAREQQLDLARRSVQVLRDRRQDRVDQPEAHERDDGRERDRPHRPGLREEPAA